MQVSTYPNAAAFLEEVQATLEENEVVNGLLLGMCLRMARYPERIETPPWLVTAGDERGPVLAAAMMPPFSLVVAGLGGDVEAAARALAAGMAVESRSVPGVQGPAGIAGTVTARLAEASGRRSSVERREYLYELRAVRSAVPAQGRLRPATEADAGTIARWWYDSNLAAFGEADAEQSARVARRCIADGDVYVWDVGRPVSMAARVAPPTKTGITIGRVYTPPEERGRGYAMACTGELSRLLLAQGRAFCTLFVEVGNAAAQGLYERIGYRRVEEFAEIALEE
jgi:hypothetical protein